MLILPQQQQQQQNSDISKIKRAVVLKGIFSLLWIFSETKYALHNSNEF